ncbi:hypothetical protein CHO01_29090 [Cellulomonas hominis]|uniref:Uncharacterized protein n=1 Tax=Cellulomonas hominis TaxID=156981 RepID=A0A511FF02_9CELL|nr:hypothetical protein [Cellulomonas hominis]MBB5474742.1 hypothetical protein [Cellulomonas hominis]NKY05398.1 hypothetical protein [Cellulomonas hominis]GEL47793.1 hypothetical protein CHO01_29090 [Cellulomonas hominis]
MSERMTGITLPGLPPGAGLADYGRKSPQEMITQLRAHATVEARNALAILAAAEEDFRVETYTGVHVRRDRQVLQPGRDPQPAPELPEPGADVQGAMAPFRVLLADLRRAYPDPAPFDVSATVIDRLAAALGEQP